MQPRPQGICCLSANASRQVFCMMQFISSKKTNGPENQVNQMHQGKTKLSTAKPKSSRQNQIHHRKTKSITAKPNSPWHNQFHYCKTKFATTKANLQIQIQAGMHNSAHAVVRQTYLKIQKKSIVY